MSALFKAASDAFEHYVTLRVRSQINAAVEEAKKKMEGVALLLASLPFLAIGLFQFSVALFCAFAGLNQYALPAVWTGLCLWGVGGIVILAGMAFMRGKESAPSHDWSANGGRHQEAEKEPEPVGHRT